MPIAFQGSATPFGPAEFDAAVRKLGCAPEALWSLIAVETSGFGYLPDRRPQILFERHHFHRRTGGRYSAAHPDISNPEPGGYSGSGPGEYARLQRAMALDETAALESTSWGLGQIMGFNARTAGFGTVQTMVAHMVATEAAHLSALAGFIAGTEALLRAFRQRDWPKVAFYYNGPGYSENRYDEKLGQHYEVFCDDRPDIELRFYQGCLKYLNYLHGNVDGVSGPATRAAVRAFRAARGLPPGDQLDDRTRELLRAASGF